MRDNHSNRDGEKSSKHDDPPNSRLFITQTKNVSDEELRNAFEKFGTVEDVYLCRDKNTGEQKDIAFVKFAKTSDAARAMESLNGHILEGHTRSLRVTIALSRDQPTSGVKTDDMERILRLFVVVPKVMTENELTKEFKEYGDLEYVSIVRDRDTKESKGYAFVKFKKASDAAAAFENCDRSFKAVFARPKEQDAQKRSTANYSGGEMFERPYSSRRQASPSPFTEMSPSYNRSEYPRSFSGPELNTRSSGKSEAVRISGDVSSELSDNQLTRLFGLMPGFVSVVAVRSNTYLYDPHFQPLRLDVCVEYNSLSAANYAFDKLNGFEYPIGNRIYLNPSFERNEVMMSGKRDATGLSTTPEITQELATIKKALAEATNMIKLQAAGGTRRTSMSSYDGPPCSVRLPSQQPLARRDSKMEERLFISGQPALPPQSALWDVFGRFGDLIEVFIINGKNCGFINYARKESADNAIEALNGEDICNMKVKITYADPPKYDSRKRIKMDTNA